MTHSGTAGSRGNALLARFPAEVRAQLEITDQRHDLNEIVVEADEFPRWAYFPHFGAVISLTRTTEAGGTVEVGVIGWEGVSAVQALLLPRPTGSDGVVQVAGSMSRVPFAALRTAMNESQPVRELLLAFAGAFLSQVSQHATCNRMHSIEQRLAKWLLTVRDRIDTDEVELTHDFLAHMLGTRRAGATVAVGALALDGLIDHSRGRISIMDREGLEERTCECYRLLRDLAPPRERVNDPGRPGLT